MSHFKTFISHHFHTLLKPQNPLHRSHITNSYFSHKSLPLSYLFYGTKTSSIQIDEIGPENGNGKQVNKKPLHVMFKEAVSVTLCENAENSESEGENSELKSRLRELEREVRRLKANSSAKESAAKKELKKSKLYAAFTNQEGCKEGCEERREEPEESVEKKGLKKSKGKSLYAAFTNQEGCKEGCEERREEPEESVEKKGLKKSKGKSLYAAFTNQEGCKEGCEKRREEPEVYKELSPDMEVFANHLYEEGYFNDANFLRANKLEFGYFESHYGRGFMKFAAEKFGKDHQEIAK